MRYGSVCSGIEAASVAWKPLGWSPAWYSETAAFPSAVLAHRHSTTPNLGDMTTLVARRSELGSIDVLVGGTPCQSFSVAGLRAGLADPRGNLALVFLGLADALGPEWVVWENVPGVLSSTEGRDLGAFLGALGQLGYGWAYRVLDAQYFGLAQRRHRVFVVASLGDWRRAAAVLFERACLRGDPAPGRAEGKAVARSLTSRPTGGGGPGTDFDLDGGIIPILEATTRQSKSTQGSAGIGKAGDPMFTLQAGAQHGVALALNAKGGTGRPDPSAETYVVQDVAGALRAEGFDASEDGTGRQPLVFNARQDPISGELAQPLDQLGYSEAVAFDTQQITSKANRNRAEPGLPVGTLSPLSRTTVGAYFGVRRLTPIEWERLQGFPDDYTLVPYRGKPAKDGPRYKAIGNSMPVPVMAWIGRRIEAVSNLKGT